MYSMGRFRSAVCPHIGLELFTSKAAALFNRIRQDIIEWRYSGEHVFLIICIFMIVYRIWYYIHDVTLIFFIILIIDAEAFEDGQWRRVPLFTNLQNDERKLPIWSCARGTNKNENYFRYFHDLFSTGNNSIETATRVFAVFNVR